MLRLNQRHIVETRRHSFSKENYTLQLKFTARENLSSKIRKIVILKRSLVVWEKKSQQLCPLPVTVGSAGRGHFHDSLLVSHLQRQL